MARIIAKNVKKADVGLQIRTYPSESLFKAKEQWQAMVRGRLDMSVFPLAYASGRHPAFNATLMPGIIRNRKRVQHLDGSKFMAMIKHDIQKGGVKVVTDAWFDGGFLSSKQCITSPDTVKGLTIRGAGPAFERMLKAAGGSVTSMSSAEIYQAMQTGVLDAANTSTASFLAFRLYEQGKCLTVPGKNTLWYMYEPILISMKTWKSLKPKQQDAIMAAGKKAEQYFAKQAAALDQKLVNVYRKHGVKIVQMSDKDFQKWMAVAKQSSFKHFENKVSNGAALIKAAQNVK
jgi:TRAP-type C4-dicarboxylate transport system substrate-binding protein